METKPGSVSGLVQILVLSEFLARVPRRQGGVSLPHGVLSSPVVLPFSHNPGRRQPRGRRSNFPVPRWELRTEYWVCDYYWEQYHNVISSNTSLLVRHSTYTEYSLTYNVILKENSHLTHHSQREEQIALRWHRFYWFPRGKPREREGERLASIKTKQYAQSFRETQRPPCRIPILWITSSDLASLKHFYPQN